MANDARYLTNQSSTAAEMIVPVVIEGRVAGTLDIEAATPNAFTDDARARFERLAAALLPLLA